MSNKKDQPEGEGKAKEGESKDTSDKSKSSGTQKDVSDASLPLAGITDAELAERLSRERQR